MQFSEEFLDYTETCIDLFKGKNLSISELALEMLEPYSKVRYAVQRLVDTGRVKKVPIKAYNKYYVRYTYEVLPRA